MAESVKPDGTLCLHATMMRMLVQEVDGSFVADFFELTKGLRETQPISMPDPVIETLPGGKASGLWLQGQREAVLNRLCEYFYDSDTTFHQWEILAEGLSPQKLYQVRLMKPSINQ